MLKKAFTLVEVIVVFIVIGILAMVLFKNIKPNSLKPQEMTALAFKGLRAVEHAMSNVMEIDKANCPMGVFLVKKAGANNFTMQLKDNSGNSIDATEVANLFGKYIKYETAVGNFCSNTPYCSSTGIKGAKIAGTSMYIGFEVFSSVTNCPSYRLPNETSDTPAPTRYNKNTATYDTAQCWGKVYIDVNGIDTPNAYGQDVFIFGMGENGIAR